MPSYLVQASYTSEAIASLIKNPQNRMEVVGKAAQNLGGKLLELLLGREIVFGGGSLRQGGTSGTVVTPGSRLRTYDHARPAVYRKRRRMGRSGVP